MPTLRDTIPADTPRLVELAQATRMFKPLEIVALREVLDDYHATNRDAGHRCVTAIESDEAILGFAYFAPAAMTVGTWYLYWIAVDPVRQGTGVGRQLLAHCETEIPGRAGERLFVETSSTPHYEPTRGFYLRQGYAEAARLPDYYAAGDDMVVYWKQLAPANPK